MLMTLIRRHLQGREILSFVNQISHLKERCTCVFCAYVHCINHTNAYLRDERKLKFRIVSAQHFINEAPGSIVLKSMSFFWGEWVFD